MRASRASGSSPGLATASGTALSKKLGGKIRLTKVVFIFDGKKLKVKKKRSRSAT